VHDIRRSLVRTRKRPTSVAPYPESRLACVRLFGAGELSGWLPASVTIKDPRFMLLGWAVEVARCHLPTLPTPSVTLAGATARGAPEKKHKAKLEVFS
jgi:hypothetical protein